MTRSYRLSFLFFGALAAACAPSGADGTTSGDGGSTGSRGPGDASSATGTSASSTSSGTSNTSSATGSGGSSGTSSATASGGSSGTAGSTGSGGSIAVPPTVTSTTPRDGAIDVATNAGVSATFSEPMDCTSLTAATFTITLGAVAVPGSVICANATAVFWPAERLPSNSAFTASISTAAKSLAGVDLAATYAWTFDTSDLVAHGTPVNLGGAGQFVLLAKAAISTVPTSAITGDVGVSPVAASYITGFSLTADPSNVFARSPQVVGKVYAANYAVPTPSNLTTAVSDMQLAFTDAAGRAPDVTELGAGNIGGMTLAPGVYKWGTGLLIPTDVTLDGSADDVWIFQIAQTLTVSSGTRIGLSGGAVAKNVFWQVAGRVDVGTTAHLEGVVLTQTAVTLRTGASVNGRLFAQTALSLDGNAVSEPAP